MAKGMYAKRDMYAKTHTGEKRACQQTVGNIECLHVEELN